MYKFFASLVVIALALAILAGLGPFLVIVALSVVLPNVKS